MEDHPEEAEQPRLGPFQRLATLIRDRVALLRVLGVVPRAALLGLTMAMLLASLLPAGTAVAVAWLVDRVVRTAAEGGGLGQIAWPLTVVGLLLTVDQVTQSLLVPVRNWTAGIANGEIRSTIRQAVSVRPGIEHLESQVVRDAAALPVDNAYLFNIGAGAEGQLWLLTRFVGAIVAAAVVARYSVAAALTVFVFVAWQRSLLRRHYAEAIASGMVGTTGDGRASTYWSDVVGTPLGAKELRLFGFGRWAVERFHHHGRIPVSELSKVLLGAQRLHGTIFVLNALGALIPFLFVLRAAERGGFGGEELDAAGLAAALGGVVAVARVLSAMGWEAFSIEAAVPQLDAVARLNRYHDEERAAAIDRTPVRSADPVPHIVFENVSFSYPGADRDRVGPVLNGLDPVAWRRRLAVIFQEFTRFELSALENVALADPDNPEARPLAVAAARAAGATAIVDELPRGWDTTLSRAFTDGVDLSGGQWQRIALARALYCAQVGGQVLVLDEPTASLDVNAEVALFDQLLTQASGCTAIVVSHRYSTVRRADRIVVLADGRVAEDGSHQELHAAGGLYANLYDLQAKRFDDGEDAS